MKKPLPSIDSGLRWIAIFGLVCCGLLAVWVTFDNESDPTWGSKKWLATLAIEWILGLVVLRRSRATTGVVCGVLAISCGVVAVASGMLVGLDLHLLWLVLAGIWLIVMVVVTEVVLHLSPGRPALGRYNAIDLATALEQQPPPPAARVVRR
jgi:hypothetical protein